MVVFPLTASRFLPCGNYLISLGASTHRQAGILLQVHRTWLLCVPAGGLSHSRRECVGSLFFVRKVADTPARVVCPSESGAACRIGDREDNDAFDSATRDFSYDQPVVADGGESRFTDQWHGPCTRGDTAVSYRFSRW